MVKLGVQTGKQITDGSYRVIDVAVMLAIDAKKRPFHFLVMARHIAELRAQKGGRTIAPDSVDEISRGSAQSLCAKAHAVVSTTPELLRKMTAGCIQLGSKARQLELSSKSRLVQSNSSKNRQPALNNLPLKNPLNSAPMKLTFILLSVSGATLTVSQT